MDQSSTPPNTPTSPPGAMSSADFQDIYLFSVSYKKKQDAPPLMRRFTTMTEFINFIEELDPDAEWEIIEDDKEC